METETNMDRADGLADELEGLTVDDIPARGFHDNPLVLPIKSDKIGCTELDF